MQINLGTSLSGLRQPIVAAASDESLQFTDTRLPDSGNFPDDAQQLITLFSNVSAGVPKSIRLQGTISGSVSNQPNLQVFLVRAGTNATVPNATPTVNSILIYNASGSSFLVSGGGAFDVFLGDADGATQDNPPANKIDLGTTEITETYDVKLNYDDGVEGDTFNITNLTIDFVHTPS